MGKPSPVGVQWGNPVQWGSSGGPCSGEPLSREQRKGNTNPPPPPPPPPSRGNYVTKTARAKQTTALIQTTVLIQTPVHTLAALPQLEVVGKLLDMERGGGGGGGGEKLH